MTALWLACAWLPAREAAAASASRSDEVLLNFQDADIQAVVKAMSSLTGANFLLDPRLEGKVTIISSKPVSRSAAYQIFLSALKGAGFAAVESPGGAVKITRVGEARASAGVNADRPGNSGRWVTQIVSVRHASAPQLAQLLKPLMDQDAQLSVYAPSNTLILTAPAASVRSLLNVIDELDKRDSGEALLIPLQNASALDVVQLVNRFTESPDGGDRRSTVVPDARTNSLLVRADSPSRAESLRALIAKLDVPAKSPGQARVVYLRYADAVKLSEVLRGLAAGHPAAPGTPGAPAGAAAPEALIQADEASNALIVSGPEGAYNNLRDVIDKLDVPRAQVFVEALIAEVTLDKAAQFGVQWGGSAVAGSVSGVAATNFNQGGTGLIGSAIAPEGLAAADGLTVGLLGDKITLRDGSQIFGVAGLIRALERDSKVNILSTPNVLTLDNSEAQIMVGQNVPFLTGRFAQAAGTGAEVNPFQTIERHDVGLTLRLRPQISEGGDVKLKIYQEVSSVVPAAIGAQDIITNKRSLDTTVTVRDGHIVVLGGLIQDTVTETISAVPILGHIPVIGSLFKFRDRSKNKINLMVFLRPSVIKTPDDVSGPTLERYRFIGAEEEKARLKMAFPLPRYEGPRLPEPPAQEERHEPKPAP